MSFVVDHIKAVDGHFDRLQLNSLPEHHDVESQHSASAAARLGHLQNLLKQLSMASAAQVTLHQPRFLLKILQDAQFSSEYSAFSHDGHSDGADAKAANYEHELEWLLLGKATVQAHGIVLSSLIRQTLPLNDEAWYWSSVLDSHGNTALYSMQTSPLRFWKWSQGVLDEIRERGGPSTDGWAQFYALARNVVRQRSINDLKSRVSSPLVLIRSEVHQKQAQLTRAKVTNAAAIGFLMSNGFGGESVRQHAMITGNQSDATRPTEKWKSDVLKNISIMDAILHAAQKEDSEEDFDNLVATTLGEDPLEDYHQAFRTTGLSTDSSALLAGMKPSEAADRLQGILKYQLPSYLSYSRTLRKQNSRPSRLVRYWLPGVALLLSSSTLLRIFVKRRAEILAWIRDLGATTRDFWFNWVVDPIKKVIGTIRHDESSQVSIMSKRSLEGDRGSLERMVVDFAIDHPDGPKLSEQQIGDIRSKVQEGDLTPVLKVYEKELSSPLKNSVMGSLVRALLIQVQKTKVDVEVAMGGIDALLKSQELVFGFVGLTPGILVCAGVFRWFSSLSENRKSSSRGRLQSRSYQVLTEIDRILTRSPQSDVGTLSFKEYGLLIVEAAVLRELAHSSLPKPTFHEFLEDFNDLIDNESGVGRQIRVADRIRWAYGRWL